MPNKIPDPTFVLAIGGSDPSGGAGIQMDLLTMAACGVRGLSAISALTMQNSQGITRVRPTSQDDLMDQVSACLADFPIKWIKTGILPSPDLVRAMASTIQKYHLKCVVDPILRSGKGFPFTEQDSIKAYCEDLCPQATIITPNYSELRVLAKHMLPEVPETGGDSATIAKSLLRFWNASIIAKGGHEDTAQVVDLFVQKDRIWKFSHSRLPLKEIHGSGCCFASAITAFAARGLPLPEALADAEQVMELALQGSNTWHNTTFLNPLKRLVARGIEASAIEEVKQVVATLEGHPKGAELIPEVRSNVSILNLGGSDPQQVAAVDGRITILGGQAHCAGPIRMGCSNHTARLLLGSRKVDPQIRGVMNLKYSPDNIDICRKIGLSCVEITRQQEPASQKVTEQGTMEWIPTQVTNGAESFPDVVYDVGDFGKEPMIRLFGRSGVDLAGKLARILDHLPKKESNAS